MTYINVYILIHYLSRASRIPHMLWHISTCTTRKLPVTFPSQLSFAARRQVGVRLLIGRWATTMRFSCITILDTLGCTPINIEDALWRRSGWSGSVGRDVSICAKRARDIFIWTLPGKTLLAAFLHGRSTKWIVVWEKPLPGSTSWDSSSRLVKVMGSQRRRRQHLYNAAINCISSRLKVHILFRPLPKQLKYGAHTLTNL